MIFEQTTTQMPKFLSWLNTETKRKRKLPPHNEYVLPQNVSRGTCARCFDPPPPCSTILTCQTHLSESPVRLTCQTHLSDSPVRFTCQTHLSDSLVRLTCHIHLSNSPVRFTCKTYLSNSRVRLVTHLYYP